MCVHMFSLHLFYPCTKLKDVFREHEVQKVVRGGEVPEVFLGMCFGGDPETDPGHTGGFHVSSSCMGEYSPPYHDRLHFSLCVGLAKQDYKEMQTRVQQSNGEVELKAVGEELRGN